MLQKKWVSRGTPWCKTGDVGGPHAAKNGSCGGSCAAKMCFLWDPNPGSWGGPSAAKMGVSEEPMVQKMGLLGDPVTQKLVSWRTPHYKKKPRSLGGPCVAKISFLGDAVLQNQVS